MYKKIQQILLFVSSLLFASSSVIGSEFDCGVVVDDGLTWDYTNPNNWRPSSDAPQSRIKLVENVHFKSYIEALQKGNTSGGDPFGDIEYTLRRFPNHHRALWAISRYFRTSRFKDQARKNSLKYSDWKRTPECFFDRAMRFKPDDLKVRVIYAAHLHLSGKPKEALEQYRFVEARRINTTDFYYNYGLFLFDIKDYTKSKEMAVKARDAGHPLKGLINKLKGAGYWP
ncbi:MAG: hypothetical protein OQL20_07775 [Sedimenticola sp.]|nr:hypothetical protein [Sedimenticola sp.]